MDKEIMLYPQPGLIVRDPRTKAPLSENGEIRTLHGKHGSYWRRRIQDGTVSTTPFKQKPARLETTGGNKK